MYLNHILTKSTPQYANTGIIEFEKSRSINDGDTSNNTNLKFSGHTGTHIDAPLHFDRHGKGLDVFRSDFWFCNHPFLIEYEATAAEVLTLSKLEKYLLKIPQETDFLLIKTGFEKHRSSGSDSKYIFNGPGIAPDVGIWLRNHLAIKIIGFDFISLTNFKNRKLGREAHRSFLLTDKKLLDKVVSEPILIVEDMHLSELNECPVNVCVIPLLYQNADGAPVTVIANY